MSSDYITSVTKEGAFHEFYNMPDDLLAVEIMGMKDVLNSLVEIDARLLDSYSFCYVAEVLEIAKDALISRFIHSHALFGLGDSEKDDG